MHTEQAAPANDDGSVVYLACRNIPLIAGDEVEMDYVIEAFNQFRCAIDNAMPALTRS